MGQVIVGGAVIALALILTPVACTDDAGAKKALLDQGYTNVQTSGYSWFSCDEKDRFSTGFTAQRDGRQVEGAVCSGWFKGNTVRTF